MAPGTELEAVADIELVLGVTLAEAQTTPEHPDLLMNEGVGLSGVRDVSPCGKLHLDELERPTGDRRHCAAPVAAAGICPRRLVGGTYESLVVAFGASHQLGKRHAQCGGQAAQQGSGGLRLTA